jgi:DNA polymerase-3 subunit alpha
MQRVFADLPEACRSTLAVAERCNLELEFGQFHLPHYRVPEGRTLDSYLKDLATEGLRQR